jgi:cytochrome P450
MTVTANIQPALAERIRGLLAQANADTVPSGVLAWFGNTDFPDGDAAVPTLSQPAWEAMYFRIENAALERGTVKPLPLVKLDTRDLRPDGPLPIAIAHFRMAVPRSAFASRVRSAAADGEQRFPNDNLTAVIEERRAFAACALMHEQWGLQTPAYRGRDVSFVIDPRFHLTNPGELPPDAVDADLGDGRGFQPVTIGEPFGAHYPSGDAATVAIRCRYGDTALTARFQVAIGDRPAAPAPDDTWPLQAPAAADGTPGNAGRAWVFRAPGHTDVVNPVILVEGFPGNRSCDYLYELLNQAGTVDGLRAAGYDLVIVGLDNGMSRIQDNAGVLADCIRKASARTGAPLVVGGVSMGGIISRLALARMEAAGEPHGTRAYLSIDAPHGGTYTSLGVQWFVHSLLQAAPGLGGFASLIDAPSNQQLMIAWLNDGAVGQSPLRAELLSDLAAVGGYPKQPRKLAVSCGRGDGVGGAAQPGAQVMRWSGEPFVSVTTNTLPGDEDGIVASGSWFLAQPPALEPLVVDGGVAWDTAPGSQNTYNAEAAGVAAAIGCGTVEHSADITCGVPTVSALDLEQDPFAPVADGTGPFDAHVCSPDNVQHLQITPEVGTWILEELGAPPPQFDPHDPEFLNDPYPVYARFREQTPMTLVHPYESHWCFRYADCKRILEEKETFLKNPPGGEPRPLGPVGIMTEYPIGIFGSDPPQHTKLRSQIEPLFCAAIGQAPALATAFAADAVKQARAAGHMELVADFALPVPAKVLFKLLGIPPDPGVWEGLIAWVTTIVRAHDITQPMPVRFQGATASMALHQYLAGLVLQYQKTPGPGLIGAVTSAIGTDLTADEVQMCFFDFVVAGYLSTTYLIASGVRALLDHPDELAALRADPARMSDAVEEMLRFEPPLQIIDRYLAHDTELCGVTLHANDKVTAVIASADRDPAAFDPATFGDPDVFQIDRPDSPHLSFGGGIHHCIGAPLARLVMPAAMSALLAVPELEIAGLPQWQTDPYLRGMVNLPLRVG